MFHCLLRIYVVWQMHVSILHDLQGQLYSEMLVYGQIAQSRRDPEIPGLEIPQSRIPGLEKTVRDCNPYAAPINLQLLQPAGIRLTH